ncbi:hypothetical protein TI04_04410 [Achromatium sp. WMS2]|nr:hypothetical protein TI04_04410 [Achromatium sp. WMS2]
MVRNYCIFVLSLIATMVSTQAVGDHRGFTATATTNIRIRIAKNILLNGLRNTATASWNGRSNLEIRDKFCVASTWQGFAASGYKLVANGSGGTGTLTMNNGVDTIPYTVNWGNINGGTEKFMYANHASCQKNGIDSTNSELAVRVSSESLQAASNGIYKGTLTLMITVL